MAKGIAAATDFDPIDYETVGYFYKGGSEEMAHEYRTDHDALEALVGEDTLHALMSNGGCDSCGTIYAHGSVVRHKPSGKLLAIGQVCAHEYFGLRSVQEFKTREAAKAKKRAEVKAAALDFLAEHPGLAEALETDHYISSDLRYKLFAYGDLSERQVELAFKLQREEAERAEAAANAPTPVPVIEGPGQVIEGTVLGVKYQESIYGSTLKMLVSVETGGGAYKLWGTVPSSLDPDKGDKVRFTANVEVSEDDEAFGFFSRPRKAEVLEEAVI